MSTPDAQIKFDCITNRVHVGNTFLVPLTNIFYLLLYVLILTSHGQVYVDLLPEKQGEHLSIQAVQDDHCRQVVWVKLYSFVKSPNELYWLNENKIVQRLNLNWTKHLISNSYQWNKQLTDRCQIYLITEQDIRTMFWCLLHYFNQRLNKVVIVILWLLKHETYYHHDSEITIGDCGVNEFFVKTYKKWMIANLARKKTNGSQQIGINT